jgi:hypothetical protein
LGGEVDEGGASAGLGVDAQGAQSFREPWCGDGASGQAAGNSQRVWPGDPIPTWDCRCGSVCEQEVAERFGNGQFVLAEADEDVPAADGDLVGGHGGDPRLLLAEQEHQRRRSASAVARHLGRLGR